MPTRTDFPSQKKTRLLCPQPRAEHLIESTEQAKTLGSARCVLDRHSVEPVFANERGATEKDGTSPLRLPTMGG